MHKIIVLAAAAFISLTSFAGEVVKHRQFSSGAHGLSVSSFYTVNLKKGPAAVSTMASSEIAEYVTVKVENGIIKVALDQEKMPKELRRNTSRWTLKADVTVPELEYLSLSGAVKVLASDTFTVKDMDARMSGASTLSGLSLSGAKADFDLSGASSAEIAFDMKEVDIEASGASKISMEANTADLSLDCSGSSRMDVKGHFDEVDAECSGASKVNISGKTQSAEFECSGASSINGIDLEADVADVDASGASSISANVRQKVTIELSGASNFEYKASPSTVTVNKSVGKGCSVRKK